MGTHLLASLGSKGKNGNSLACLRNAGSHSALTYCILVTAFSSRSRRLVRRQGTRMHAHAGALLAAPPGPAMASAAIASTRPAEAPRLRIEQTLCPDFARNRQSLYACTLWERTLGKEGGPRKTSLQGNLQGILLVRRPTVECSFHTSTSTHARPVKERHPRRTPPKKGAADNPTTNWSSAPRVLQLSRG